MSDDAESKAPAEPKPTFDKAQVQQAIALLRGDQNLPVGVLAGLIGALGGAAVWGGITVATGYQIGWMAVGVGFLVGYAVRTFGKGIDKVFGIAGAVLALIGCGLGNLLAISGMIAADQEMGFFEVLGQLNPGLVKDLMVSTFSPMDLLFYGIAVYEGYRFSFRRLTTREIANRVAGANASD